MSERKRVPGAAVRAAIQKLSLTDLMLLATSLRAYSSPWATATDDLPQALEAFDGQARSALLTAFKVTVKSERREAKSPSQRKALAGEPPVDPVVRSLSGMVLREGDPPPF